MRTLYIIGTGGFAKEVAQVAQALQEAGPPRWQAIEYLARNEGEIGRVLPFGRVTGTDALLAQRPQAADVAIGIGQPLLRRAIAARLAAWSHLQAPNLVHPGAGIDERRVQLGCGNLVARGAQFTCDIEVGDFNVFNLNCTVGHDVRIGSYCVVNPGANVSGGVAMGDACLLGTGSQVLEGLSLCADATIGAGAVVTRSVARPGTYAGVPARALA
ncbi:MAG: NeuD/PglB/VioB family sugar acetyltransferase [Burkholderiales bacterium]|nr:NeuD/PglB/VioB family sugar acetyltransferase [Burkholderiales bacterium]